MIDLSSQLPDLTVMGSGQANLIQKR